MITTTSSTPSPRGASLRLVAEFALPSLVKTSVFKWREEQLSLGRVVFLYHDRAQAFEPLPGRGPKFVRTIGGRPRVLLGTPPPPEAL